MSNSKRTAKVAGMGMLLTAGGVLDLSQLPSELHLFGDICTAGGIVAVVGAAGYTIWRRSASSNRISRRQRRASRTQGTTGIVDQVRGRWRERRLADVIRPDLAGQRGHTSLGEWATPLARSNGVTVPVPLEQHIIRFGAPRSGKTSELAVRVLDAPGAAVSTSTRLDVLDLTAGVRAQFGEVFLFNPGGDGGRVSTIKWTPVAGCQDILTAQRRAAALIAPEADPSREGWARDGRDQLAVLLHAAAIVDAPIRQVQSWAAGLNRENAGQIAPSVLAALDASPARDMMVAMFEAFAALNHKTRSSIAQQMLTGLRWLNDPRCMAIADAAPSGELFDASAFFGGRNTLYLVGSDNGLHRPLTGALLDEIAERGRERAKAQPTGRLAVPGSLVLDEIKLTTTAPLDSWTADFGGFGLHLDLSSQSLSQLRGIYGRDRAEEILGNVGALVLYRHGANVEDMEHWQRLAGSYERDRETRDGDGKVVSVTTESVPTLPAAQLRELRSGEAAVFVGGQRVIVTDMPNVRDRRDVKQYASANPFRPQPPQTQYKLKFTPADAARLADEDAQ